MSSTRTAPQDGKHDFRHVSTALCLTTTFFPALQAQHTSPWSQLRKYIYHQEGADSTDSITESLSSAALLILPVRPTMLKAWVTSASVSFIALSARKQSIPIPACAFMKDVSTGVMSLIPPNSAPVLKETERSTLSSTSRVPITNCAGRWWYWFAHRLGWDIWIVSAAWNTTLCCGLFVVPRAKVFTVRKQTCPRTSNRG